MIARYIIEKCDTIGRVKKYLSMGGPLNGVARFPNCVNGIICKLLSKFISYAVDIPTIQDFIAPA